MAPWWRVLWARLRLLVLYRWRRHLLSIKTPEVEERDARRSLPPIDTGGGAYRPSFGSQFSDPTEGHSSPHSEGSNCTMASAGMALGYHRGGSTVRGGDMRHRQSDGDGGTDLYDAAEAWAYYGESLSIRSGQGWSAVVEALRAGRGVILQGTGGVASCGDYPGGHAIYVNPEASGSRWLKGDPECGGWEWTEESTLKGFATRLSSGVYFAVTADRTTSPPPTPVPTPPPEPEPCPDCPPPPDPQPLIDLAVAEAEGAAVQAWVDWLAAGEPADTDTWDIGCWADPTPLAQRRLSDILARTDCPPGLDARWARGPVLDPVWSAATALEGQPATWGHSDWTAALWAG